MEPKYINRELSWLDFNARVLQEASNKEVPILERLRFIGIFSNNLDEFFQVRYATVKRIADAKPSIKNNKDNIAAKQLLDKITSKVISLQSESSLILESIEKSLKKENIVFINEKEVPESHKEFLKDYFIRKISPSLVTVILSNNKLHDFKDNKAFLITNIKLIDDNNIYALVEIPRDISRFIVLPKKGDKQYIMLIDDIIRYHLDIIFSFFNYSDIEANMLKITRDADFDIDDIDLSKSYIKKIQEYVNKRKISNPVRLVYDKNISSSTLSYLIKKIKISSYDSLIPGGKYHHRSDYMNFPDLRRSDLLYPKEKPLDINGLKIESNLLDQISEKDFLMYTPYHSFSYLVSILRQSAIDPSVKSIKITLYRLSKKSNVISSLINAAKNGKKVLVQIELQARFDDKVSELEDLRVQLNNEISISEELRSIVSQLEVSEDSALLQRAAAEDETEVANDRFTKLLSDFQQAIIKGTKEGIERVSLTAQVQGLQAQKATLKSLLEVQKDIVAQLTSQVSGAAAESAAAASGLTPTAGNEDYVGCENDGYTVVVNGTTYDEANPTGTEVIANGNALGCDSTVTINLVFNTSLTVIRVLG